MMSHEETLAEAAKAARELALEEAAQICERDGKTWLARQIRAQKTGTGSIALAHLGQDLKDLTAHIETLEAVIDAQGNELRRIKGEI